MKKLIAPLLLILSASLFIPCLTWGADFAAGYRAAKRGDYATAFREWKPLAVQGNVVAQANLGLMYIRGQGVVKNYAKALKWLRRAATQGNAPAQYNLGRMYANGRGVSKDDHLENKRVDR